MEEKINKLVENHNFTLEVIKKIIATLELLHENQTDMITLYQSIDKKLNTLNAKIDNIEERINITHGDSISYSYKKYEKIKEDLEVIKNRMPSKSGIF